MKDLIIIPTYNEKENISKLIPLIFEILPNILITIVDDNSPDGTSQIVEELQKKYTNLFIIKRKEKNGLKEAYISTFIKILKDSNDIKSIIMMDADFAPQLKYLPEMIEKSKNYEVVIGSRYVKGGKKVGVKLWRRILGFLGNLYSRIIFGIPIHDYSCGYMVISTDLLRKVDLSKINAKGYAFIPELKYLLYKKGGKFFEVPITFIERTEGESKISFNIIWEGIFTPLKMIFKK